MELHGKVALVLGAVKGIGKALGLALGGEGVKLALNYFDWEESLEEMRQDFAESGAEHLIIRTDLTNTKAIPELVQKTVERFGRLDILINNIERGGWPVVHGKYTREQWDLELGTTLRAKQWLFEAALPHLKKSGDGAVINISSIAGVVGRCGPASYLFNEGYSSANRGISLLTETWARLGAPDVRVNELMLGIFETRHAQNTRGWGLLNDEQKAAILDHMLIPRTGNAEDVIKAVKFILKDAPYMTGSVLKIDGGYVLGGEKVAPMPPGVV